jgi:predicted membrane-bound mannosyltransferase
MKAIINFSKQHWAGIALGIIILGAFFVRTYHFHDWLYFKMDQSRDAMLIGNAVKNGPEYLPLLGARAGATQVSHGYLRLGPAFYYFQYISGKLFNSTKPDVFAYPDLFFSLLAIPMLYAFSRLYFSKKYSLIIAGLYSCSYLIIEYSRFAWNPNSLQFFTLLCLYGLLRFMNEENPKRKKWFLVMWAFALFIGSQLHFFGFFALVGISGLMFFWHYRLWNKLSIQEIFKKNTMRLIAINVGLFFLVFLFTYTPEIISEVMKHGENTQNFFEALHTKPVKKPLLKKLTKNATESVKYYSMITTGEIYKNDFGKDPAAAVFTLTIFLGAILVVIARLRKGANPLKRDFLLLLIVWIGVFFILSIPVSFQIRPRFFILMFAVPFIFIALVSDYLEERFGKKGLAVGLVVILFSLISNISGTREWFREQTHAQTKVTPVTRTLILKNKDGVTLGQLEGAANWMYQKMQPGKNLYFYVKPEHNNPIRYLLSQKNDPALNYSVLRKTDDPNGQYFASP